MALLCEVRAVLTHAGVKKLLGRLICAHVDGPCGNVAQQHRAESSVKPSHAVLIPYDTGSAGEALIYCARGSCVLPWAEGALRLQAGLDNIKRARHNSRRNTSRGTAEGIHGPIGEPRDAHGEGGQG